MTDPGKKMDASSVAQARPKSAFASYSFASALNLGEAAHCLAGDRKVEAEDEGYKPSPSKPPVSQLKPCIDETATASRFGPLQGDALALADRRPLHDRHGPVDPVNKSLRQELRCEVELSRCGECRKLTPANNSIVGASALLSDGGAYRPDVLVAQNAQLRECLEDAEVSEEEGEEQIQSAYNRADRQVTLIRKRIFDAAQIAPCSPEDLPSISGLVTALRVRAVVAESRPAQAVAMLRECEWRDRTWTREYGEVQACPSCDGADPCRGIEPDDVVMGHADDCPLAAFLAECETGTDTEPQSVAQEGIANAC